MKPNDKSIEFAIECLEKSIEEFDRLIQLYPNDCDATESGGWWESKKELEEVVRWIEEIKRR